MMIGILMALFLIFLGLGFSAYGILVWLITWFLFAIARIDKETMIIPNRLVLGLLLLVPFSICLAPEITIGSRILGAFVVSFPMLVLTMLIPGCFGGGDIKLILVGGLLLGWIGVLAAIYLAILTGGIYGAYLLSARKMGRGEHFAFGPFLTFGIWISLLYQDKIVEWYLSFL